MDKTIAELEALTAEAKKNAEEAGGTDESLNQLYKEAEDNLSKAKTDLELKKERERLESELPPKRTEKEKAKFTVESIFERHPEIRDELNLGNGNAQEENPTEKKLLRNQVEGIIRQSTKSEEEVKYKMFFYDNRIVKTGNVFEDADNASWLASKERTRNTIEESKRKVEPPTFTGGAGQKPNLDGAPQLSVEDIRRLQASGFKQVSPTRWEGEKVILEWDKNAKKWNETFR